jgi:hypothetical protein
MSTPPISVRRVGHTRRSAGGNLRVGVTIRQSPPLVVVDTAGWRHYLTIAEAVDLAERLRHYPGHMADAVIRHFRGAA